MKRVGFWLVLQNMEGDLNNARVLELCQLYILAVNKIVSDLEPSRVSNVFRGVDALEVSGIEVVLTNSLRIFMNNSKFRLEELMKHYDLENFLSNIEKKDLESQILEDLSPNKAASDLARIFFQSPPQPSSHSSLVSYKESLLSELKSLSSETLYQCEEKDRIFEKIMQLRLKLITNLGL